MKLETLLKQLEFKEEIKHAIFHQFSKNEKKIKEIAASAYDIKEDTFLLYRAKPLTRLTTVVYLFTFKYDEYQALKIPDPIIINPLKDVTLRSNLYLKTTGKIGITKEDVIWFRHILKIELFKIESLQFQPFEMIYLDEETLSEPYMSFELKQKKALPSKTPVINVHVQYGAKINAELVKQSLQEAIAFFKLYYPSVSYQAFFCYNWLLYEPTRKYLKENSNIYHFAKRFNIIGYCDDATQAKEYLFKEKRANLSSLQKAFLEHQKDFGFACGIINIK